MFKVLVVEDDPALRKLFCTVLNKNGYKSIEAKDGHSALDVLYKEYIDLIISDIMMPNMDGYTLTKLIRESNNNVPILMITAKETFSDKQEGFRVGTDDYMVKPIDVNEMILRVGALLRRSQIINERRIVIGETTFLYDFLSVKYNNKELVLPQKEFYLIYKLVSTPNKIFT